MAKKSKVILIKSDPKLGQKGDVVEVSTGHARNYLIPNKIAIIASKDALKNKDNLEKRKVDEKNKEEALLIPILEQISSKGVEFICHANENGQLFGSINIDTIKKSLSEDFGLKMGKDTKVNINIKLDNKEIDNIRHLGNYEATINFPSFSSKSNTEFIVRVKALKR